MGTDKVKLVIGMITGNEALFEKTACILEKRFGAVDYESPALKFDYTDYYDAELGRNLKRKFMCFKKLIEQDDLAGIKVYTNNLEQRFLKKGNRSINLDPGYLSEAKLVLATTKDYAHRIYLRKGIYAEVTLRFRNGSYRPWQWTYPDYRSAAYIRIFNEMRSKWKT